MLLKKASLKDCAALHEIQKDAFGDLMELSADGNRSSGAQNYQRMEKQLLQKQTDYYLIQVDEADIGMIRILRVAADICRISQLIILPEYQGQGYAQQAVALAEKAYPSVVLWQLDAEKHEKKLRHLYEKMGYRKTGNKQIISDTMTIIKYEKLIIRK